MVLRRTPAVAVEPDFIGNFYGMHGAQPLKRYSRRALFRMVLTPV